MQSDSDQDQRQNAGSKSLEEMFSDAEQTLRKSLETLTEWGDQARNVMQDRPGVVLASISIAGFMTGLMLRQGKLNPRQKSLRNFSADPMVMFVTGVIAGLTVGPKVIRDVTEASTSGRALRNRQAERKGAEVRSMRPSDETHPSL